ncbi:MAG: type V CRISPR-associated protein Cas12a/Cpf1, partial [Nanoarchaeota archaeon]|nr:type V CRISPR-associated protein Cas12a/Cpf1 [Nanoarchaeota archaeon]
NYDLEDIFKKEYEHIDDFYRETNSRLYKITFEKELSEAWLYKQVANEKIYLFEIHNKDFNPKSIGKKNLHTLYWEMLFDKKNLADVVFKLNGEAKVFYRKASIHKEKRILHPVGCQVAKKFFRLEDGNFEPVPSESIDRLNRYYLSKFEKKEDKDVLLEEDKKYLNNFTIVKKYDVDEEGKWEDFSEEKKKNCARIKDKRFTKDKILFHCPIEINFKSKNTEFINTKVLEFLHKRDDVNIIGLDRGERNLIYLSMINTNGEIVEGMQFSLNKLSSVEEEKRKEIDYHKLLSSKEEERLKARKNWETIENIKNLKEGYLSQVVHQLAKLVIEKNAIIVLENLNSYIKEKRGAKVEKSIYQKFENMLIKKFQYLVLNKNNLYGKGGVLKGYQLTNKTIPPFKYMSKQEGFLFFVPPDYTSKICPSTGFINLLNTKFTSKENAIKFFEKINLSYDKEYEYFRFDFDYKMFDSLRVDVNELKQTKWSVCSHSAPRSTVVKENNKWFYKKKDINAELKKLFKENNIDFEKDNLDLVLQDKNSKLGAKFYESLLKQFSVLLALRHTWEDEEGKHDAIVSSVEVGERGSNKFFNSEEKKKKGKNKEGGWIGKLPVDADANGAYNIALKGLWLLNELNSEDDKEKAVKKFNELKKAKFIKEKKKNGEEKKKYVRRWCSNTDWLKFVHERNSK